VGFYQRPNRRSFFPCLLVCLLSIHCRYVVDAKLNRDVLASVSFLGVLWRPAQHLQGWLRRALDRIRCLQLARLCFLLCPHQMAWERVYAAGVQGQRFV
jgi:hypothetical protein